MIPESRAVQARRWAMFPATVLFALSVVWLTYKFFDYLALGNAFTHTTHTGLGILGVTVDLLVIPIGGAVVGIYLLLRKRWAAPVAAVIPILPLATKTASSLARVSAQFHDYHINADFKSADNAMIGLFVILALWAGYVVMLGYLYKVWTLLRDSKGDWAARSGSGGTAGKGVTSDGDHGATTSPPVEDDECFLMPETEDSEKD